jgi:hypothetical protein
MMLLHIVRMKARYAAIMIEVFRGLPPSLYSNDKIIYNLKLSQDRVPIIH